ncbi:MAG: TPM domain-containing protein [Flavobacteriales bacterium]|nr:TPM domain-containing protein [Flavobacteriales bacterium]
MLAERFLTPAERERVKAAIAQAEHATSGELRVHLEDRCEEDVLDHAAFIFDELGMHRTAARNGVLIYVSVGDHRLAVIGDAGINAVVPPNFWNDVLGVLRLHFAAGRHADGLCEAARMVGEKLKAHFPRRSDDRNELPDDISIG